MRDSEREYPPHQPQRGSRRRPPEEHDYKEDLDDQDAPAEGAATRSRYAAVASPAVRLPRHRWRDTLIIGVIAGFLCIAQNIIVTLRNAPSYHAYEVATSTTVQNALAFTIFVIGLQVFGITLLICLIAGFVAGRLAVRRSLGFLTGFIAGVLFDGSVIITHYIPGYPGNQHGGAPASNIGSLLGGVAFAAVVLIATGIIAGLFSLLGSWIATRRHPYYVEG